MKKNNEPRLVDGLVCTDEDSVKSSWNSSPPTPPPSSYVTWAFQESGEAAQRGDESQIQGRGAEVWRQRLAAAALTWDVWVAEGALISISFLSCFGSESYAQRSLTWWTELLWLGSEKREAAFLYTKWISVFTVCVCACVCDIHIYLSLCICLSFLILQFIVNFPLLVVLSNIWLLLS